MITLDSATLKIKEKSAYLASEYGVGNIGIFGSVAKQTATEKSDIDIVVGFRIL